MNGGWAIRPRAPNATQKYHLYRDGKSLCRRHHFQGPYTAPKPGEGQSPVDCKTCWKRWRFLQREPRTQGVTKP